MSAPTPSSRTRLFLSYGQRDATDLARRLCADLEGAGYDVWLDRRRIRTGEPWGEQAIRDGLDRCRAVVALLSPHSTRLATTSPDRLTSVCLNELYHAKFTARLPIVPVLAAPGCQPPLILNELHYTDLSDPAQYALRLPGLLEDVAAAVQRGQVRYRPWYQLLHPLDGGDYLAERRRDFVGRQWLFERIDAWRQKRPERALLVTGDPGVGKTALVAQLAHLNPGGQVLAYHCCRADDPDTTDPARFVQALACQLGSQLDGYAARLEGEDLKQALSDAACTANPAGAFERAILAPLLRLPAPAGGPRYLLIDALDEALAGRAGGPSLVALLAPRLERLPAWLRLVATSRPEHEVRRRLGALRVEPIQAGGRDNRLDLDDYLAARLGGKELAERLTASGRPADEVRRDIAAKAAGNFLYAQQVLLGVEHDVFRCDDLAALPPGLAGIYDAFFERLFPGAASYAPARRVLEVVAAAAQPLTRAQLAAAAGLGEYDFLDVLRLLTSYLPERDGTQALYHRSLGDWLADAGGRFHASAGLGHQALADVGWREYEGGAAAMSAYMLQHLPGHLAGSGQAERREQLLSDLDYLFACGELYDRLGNVRGASDMYERAVGRCRERAAADPDNAGWQRDLSVSLNKLGDVRTARGDLAGAEEAFGQSLDLRRRLAAADPHNAGWQRDLSVSYERLGDVRTARGDLAGAEEAFGQSLDLRRRLAAADPHNAGWQRDLSVSYERLGDVRTARGDLAGAEEAFGQSLDLRRRLAAADPHNAGWQRDLSVSLNKLGDVRTARGDLAGAEEAFGQSLDLRRRLAAADPHNAGWQRDLAVSHYKLATLHQRAGAAERAERSFRSCWEVLGLMRATHLHLDPATAEVFRELDRRFGG